MNAQELNATVARFWDEQAIPALVDYIRIPNKSPAFDRDWAANGHMEQATQLYAAFAERALSEVKSATVEVFRIEGRTPVILIDVPATAVGSDPDAPILFYGHLDKQPEAEGWSEGMGPWTPVVKDAKLYGRGSADDGYAMFGALGAILAVEAQGAPHARCVVLIEACEESGSYDLPAYIEMLKGRLGTPALVVCLDSGCGNYDQLWLTTSLRGMVGGNLKVEVLEEGVHSGLASGIVPSSFRILRTLLSRVEDEETGAILPTELQAQIPPDRAAQAKVAAQALGDEVWNKFAYAGGTRPMGEDDTELLLNQTWRPTLSITGLEGAPPLGAAGNVLRPYTAAKLSVRLPPTADANAAGVALKALLEKDPPYGAKVSFTYDKAGAGPGWTRRWSGAHRPPTVEASRRWARAARSR